MALIFGALGAVVVAAAGQEFDDTYGGSLAVSGAAVGGVAGLVLGAVIGMGIPRWERRVP